jgi:uncharacterized protein (TIGR02217 family)
VIETPLDDCVAYGFRVDPKFNTQIVTLDSGAEQRNGNWTRPKRDFSARYGNFTKVQFAILQACYMACRGSLYAFLIRDHFDYIATNESQGTTPGANSTPVQLRKTYTFGATSITRDITKPEAGTVVMQQSDGVGGWVTKAGTTDTTTGLFTPSTNWTAGRALRASFQFYVPVRFVGDSFPSSFDDINAINTDCELQEVFGE